MGNDSQTSPTAIEDVYIHGKLDRRGWPPGEWDNEPDAVWFTHQGRECRLVRNNFGAWCGYVSVAAGSPLNGSHYYTDDDHPINDVRVHGGLTYASQYMGDEDVQGRWWFGFDCAHCYDIAPGLNMLRYGGDLTDGDSHYRPMDWVREETVRLADQISKIENDMALQASVTAALTAQPAAPPEPTMPHPDTLALAKAVSMLETASDLLKRRATTEDWAFIEQVDAFVYQQDAIADARADQEHHP
jgi:hypothetical protein